MNERQFVAVQFNPWDTRTYTYHNDAEPVSEGDTVSVSTHEGIKRVLVVSVSDIKPSFPTKPICAEGEAA